MAATIPIEITEEQAAALADKARLTGTTVEDLARNAVVGSIGKVLVSELPSGDELVRRLRAIAEIVGPGAPPVSLESLRRENLYSDDDENADIE